MGQKPEAILNRVEDLEYDVGELEESVTTLQTDQTFSQRLSDLEDRIKRMEKAVTSQLGARLQ